MKKKDYFKIILSTVIISQLIIAPHFIYAQDNRERVIVDGSIESNSVEDIGFLTKQSRIDFSYSGDTRVEVSRVSLSKLNMSLDKPQILNPYTELRYEYHNDTNELWIVYSVINKKTKKQEDICAHVFEEVVLTSNVTIDQNMVAFATPEGIRLTLIERIVNTGFIEPIFVPLISPKGLKKDGVQYNISNLQFINTNTQDITEIFEDEPSKQLYAGDQLVTQISEDGTKSFHGVIDRFDIVNLVRNQLIGILFLSSMYMDRQEQQDLVDRIESILSKEVPLIQEYYASANEIFAGGSADDLIIHTLKNIGAGDTLKSMVRLLSVPNGATNSKDDVMKQYTTVKRKVFTPQDVKNISDLVKKYSETTGKTQLTQQDFDEIETIYEQGQIKDILENSPNIGESIQALVTRIEQEKENSWNAKVQEYTESVKDKLKGSVSKTQAIYNQTLKSVKEIWSNLVTEHKIITSIAAVSTIAFEIYANLKSMGVHIGIDQVDYLVQHFRTLLGFGSNIPVVNIITETLEGFMSYIWDEWNMWNVNRLILGTMLAFSLFPISLLIAKVGKKDHNKTTWQTFFGFGIQYYAKLCYPISKMILDKIGQKNIYPQLERGLKPIFTKLGLAQEQIDKIIKKTTDEYTDHQDDTLLSKVLAASIVETITQDKTEEDLSVDEKLSEDNAYMMNVVELLSKDPATKISYILDTVGESGEKYEMMNYIAAYIYEILIKAEAKKGSKINKENLLADINTYLDIKTKVLRDPSAIRPESKFKKLKRSIGSFFSKSLPSFLLYGQSGLELYKKYNKNVEIDEVTSKTTGASFGYDYVVSTIIYAGVAAQKFSLFDPGNWEIAANQGGQVFIFGIQGAVDPLSIAASNIFSMPQAYLPKTDKIHKYTKKQSLKESFKIALTKSDTLSRQGYFATHAQYIKNFADGFNARFVADFLPRFLALTAIGITAGTLGGLGSTVLLAIKTGFLSSYFLVAKICLTPMFVGYFAIWAYVFASMKKVNSSAAFYKNILTKASNLLDQGVKFNDVEKARKAVTIFKSLYYTTKTPLDLEWQKPTTEFSISDAVSFNEYVKENLPVSTEKSDKFYFIVNAALGSIISTVLFSQVSSKVYDENLTTLGSLGLLGLATVMLGITYGGLILADKAGDKLTQYVKEYVDTKDPQKLKSLTKIVDNYIEDSSIDKDKVKQVIRELVNSSVFEEPQYLSRQELYDLVLQIESTPDCISLFSEKGV